jgi:hypothetical protein
MLLAQYGRFEGLEAQLERWQAAPAAEPPASLLVAIALTRDTKYLPPLRRHIEMNPDIDELRKVLGYLRGVRGREARELRRAINYKLLRQ